MSAPLAVVLDVARPGWENMAVDAALLDLSAREGLAFLRLYRWSPFCLSFGRHERALRRYDRDRIRELGLDCVRRPTGGRAVWHARELTYSVVAPLTVFGGLREAYRAIHQRLARAIERLGAAPGLAPPAAPLSPSHGGPCFAAPVGGEVLLQGRKIVGSAQLRQDGVFLQHGSLLLEDDQSLVADLSGRQGGSEITLAAALGRTVTFDQAAEVIRAEWAEATECTTADRSLLRGIEAGARPHASRFRDPAWTWCR